MSIPITEQNRGGGDRADQLVADGINQINVREATGRFHDLIMAFETSEFASSLSEVFLEVARSEDPQIICNNEYTDGVLRNSIQVDMHPIDLNHTPVTDMFLTLDTQDGSVVISTKRDSLSPNVTPQPQSFVLKLVPNDSGRYEVTETTIYYIKRKGTISYIEVKLDPSDLDKYKVSDFDALTDTGKELNVILTTLKVRNEANPALSGAALVGERLIKKMVKIATRRIEDMLEEENSYED